MNMDRKDDSDQARFDDVVQGLINGDFSRLEPSFTEAGPADRWPLAIKWHQEGRFGDQPKVLAEALTCACFLGRTEVAEYLLNRGSIPQAARRLV